MEKKTVYFNDLVNLWLDGIKGARALSTYTKYMQLSRKHIIPFFKQIVVTDISDSILRDFQKVLEDKQNLNTTLSAGNLRCIVMIVNTVLENAYQQGMILSSLSMSTTVKKEKHIAKAFSTNERLKLEKFLISNLTLSNLGVYMCLYTGLRLGEICSLRWQDINLDDACLFIRHTVQRLPSYKKADIRKTRLVLSQPKSHSSMRIVPITSNVLPFLCKEKRTSKPDNYLLTGTSLPMDPRTLQYQYKRCLTNAGIPYCNFHTLRHTFATRCIMCGIDPKTLSEILGHSDIKITLEYYFHTSLEFKKKQMELLCTIS